MMTPEEIAPYILRALADAQKEGRVMDLETLSLTIQVRRADVRKTVSALHEQGLVDALRLRLSLAGFAMGTAFLKQDLPPIRRQKVAVQKVNAA
jgi:DNA-binding IclR family transcriptional regulator